MPLSRFEFTLPGWVLPWLETRPEIIQDPEDRMRFAIDLADRNVRQETGGPFGAAVFELETGRLISAGVNLVVSQGSSVLHAEITALMLAHKALGAYQLNHPELPACELVTSVEPCAMCLGAIPWSGVRQITCGAFQEDAECAGFDEGANPADWTLELEQRGIRVVRGLLRKEAAAVLHAYYARGGPIYNGNTGKP